MKAEFDGGDDMVTDAMVEAIQIFNEMQGGSSAVINVLLDFLKDWDEDEWNKFTEDEKKTLVNDYTNKLYF